MNKKNIIIAASATLLVVVVYSSIASLSKARNKSNDYEYYYTDESIAEADSIVSDYKAFSLTHDTDENTVLTGSVTIDTDPESIAVFVNKEYSLPADYIPSDLTAPNVPFNFDYSDEKRMLREEAAFALEDLFQAASNDGLSLYGVSGFRSYDRQEQIYNKNVATKGIVYTNQYSAKPGYSEHQTGLSIDVSAKSVAYRLDESFASSPEGKWLEKHAYEYGFIIRYPEDKSDITGYSYEPWHIRYVGKDLAEYLYKNELTLEEFYHYTPSISFVEEYAHDSDVDTAEIPENTTSNEVPDKDTSEDTDKDQEEVETTADSRTKDDSKEQDSKQSSSTKKSSDKDTNASNSNPNKNTSTTKDDTSDENTASDDEDTVVNDDSTDTEPEDTDTQDTDGEASDTQDESDTQTEDPSAEGTSNTDQDTTGTEDSSDVNGTDNSTQNPTGTETSTNTGVDGTN